MRSSHTPEFRARSPRHTAARAIALAAMLGATACDGSNGALPFATSTEARRLTGAWDLSLQIDPRSALGARRADTLSGTLALLVPRHGVEDVEELRGLTHSGVYDIGFDDFGWGTEGDVAPARAVGRMVPGRLAHHAADSVYLVLSPGRSSLVVRLAGILRGDSVTGTWRANAYRNGGGAGWFVMRRRAAAR